MPDIDFKRYKPFLIYVIGFISFVILIYLSIPSFFNYTKHKDELERKIFENFSLKTSIQGKIKYKFLPYPSLEIEEVNLKGSENNKFFLGSIDKVILKIPFKHLVSIKKINFSNLEIKKAKIRIDLDQFEYYKNFFYENFKSKPIKFSNSQINFYDKDKHIASIDEAYLNYLNDITVEKTVLKGNFLGDRIVVKLQNRKNRDLNKTLSIKLRNLGLSSVINLSGNKNLDDQLLGNFKLNFKDHAVISNFIYKNKSIEINGGKVKNNFFNGKIYGIVNFYPFFDFNLNLDIRVLNFINIYKKLSDLNEESKSDFFSINRKINGILNLNIDKINSTTNLINSIESELEFINGNIFFHKFLLNLYKIGASDITGNLVNDGKNANFNFKQNIYIDNLKYFYRKFDIPKKEYINPQNLFVSGRINLKSMNIHIDEIDFEKKVEKEEINFIEENFNLILLDEGYKTFFDFIKLKEFVNLVLTK